MLFTELNHMSWLLCIFLQVPNGKVFTLVNCKKFTKPSIKMCHTLITFTQHILCLFISIRLICFLRFLLRWLICLNIFVIKVQLAPFDLRYGRLCLLVPHRQWTGVIFMIETTEIEKNKLISNLNLLLTKWSRMKTLLADILCHILTGLSENSIQSCPFIRAHLYRPFCVF